MDPEFIRYTKIEIAKGHTKGIICLLLHQMFAKLML